MNSRLILWINLITSIYTGLILITACSTNREDVRLQIALQEVDENPQQAIRWLDRIPSPESLDKNSYMRYIVILTQARYMDYQDITQDTRILDAQCYFAREQDPEMAARASYYAAAYWRENGEEEKVLEYHMLANQYAREAGNDLFQAKSAHWIGNFYFNQEILDSARFYYHQGEELYPKDVNNERNRMEIIYMIGRTYNVLKQFDQALIYINEGMEMAQKLNDYLYEARFAQYKGNILTEMKAYPEAMECLNYALLKKPLPVDSLRVFLNYSRLYRRCNQPDSSKYYLDQVKNRMDEISYSGTLEWASEEFAIDFHQRLRCNRVLKTAYYNKKYFDKKYF